MGVVNSQKRTKDTKFISKPVFYPLNQFHESFVQKAKLGVSEINWLEVLSQISNEVDEGSLDIEMGFEY